MAGTATAYVSNWLQDRIPECYATYSPSRERSQSAIGQLYVHILGSGRGTHESLDIVASDDTGLAAENVFETHFGCDNLVDRG